MSGQELHIHTQRVYLFPFESKTDSCWVVGPGHLVSIKRNNLDADSSWCGGRASLQNTPADLHSTPQALQPGPAHPC